MAVAPMAVAFRKFRRLQLAFMDGALLHWLFYVGWPFTGP